MGKIRAIADFVVLGKSLDILPIRTIVDFVFKEFVFRAG